LSIKEDVYFFFSFGQQSQGGFIDVIVDEDDGLIGGPD
jgi:hypothetical protein